MEVKNSYKKQINESYERVKEVTIENKKFNSDVNIEIEAKILQSVIKKENFGALLKYLLSPTLGLKYEPQEDQLDVSFTNEQKQYRYSITGQKDILEYCKSNSIATIQGYLMTKSQFKLPVHIREYAMRINFNTEGKVDDKEKKRVLDNLARAQKYFRYKKRFSFYSEDGNFRYDLTIVKSSIEGKSHFNLLSSGLFQVQEHYEVEIEYLVPVDQGKWPSPDEFVKSLFVNASLILRVLHDDDHIISDEKKEAVKKNYNTLVQNKNKTTFVGPMAVTLEQNNLKPPGLGINSILEDYTVTDKADGERQLLFIDTDGRVYMIARNLIVKYTGLKNETMSNTLMDGEYITKSITGKPLKKFMSFDIYYHKGVNVCRLPLMSADKDQDSRYKKMSDVCNARFQGDDTFTIEPKKFQAAVSGDINGIFKASKSIWEQVKNTKLYEVDGLIFTPRSLPVGSPSLNTEPRLTGTWNKLFKWKPQNTIDFLVKTEKNDLGSDVIISLEGQDYKQLKLFVGYNATTTGHITPHMYITNNIPKDATYADRQFSPSDYENASTSLIPLSKNTMVIPSTGEVINDNDVVEFYWEQSTLNPDGCWKPLLIRKDKTRGNDYTAAMNAWRAIKYPITEKMIVGDSKVIFHEDHEDSDLYYNPSEKRNDCASRNMNYFHNWVKRSHLIEVFKGHKLLNDEKMKGVFDIACGRMGDMMKYCEAGFETIIGVDKSSDNITTVKEGAYKRLLNNMNDYRYSKYKKNKFLFLPMDFSKVINSEYISSIKDSDTQEIINVLWGTKSNRLYGDYYGLIDKRFELVSCQFAIHYFFQNKTTLNALLTNINTLIKDGGYFVGTCLDGMTVDKTFRDKSILRGKSISGQKDERTMWDVEKQYDVFDLENPDNNYGMEIDVYMETIGKRFKEYLVDFRLLEKELLKYQIRPLTYQECIALGVPMHTGIFKTSYNDYIKTNRNNRFDVELSPEEKEYSFMNRWFMFKKDTSIPFSRSSLQRTAQAVPEKKTVVKRYIPKKKPEHDECEKIGFLENENNSCYIDSIFMALFHKPNVFSKMIVKDDVVMTPDTKLIRKLHEQVRNLHDSIRGAQTFTCTSMRKLLTRMNTQDREFTTAQLDPRDVMSILNNSFGFDKLNMKAISSREKKVGDKWVKIREDEIVSIPYYYEMFAEEDIFQKGKVVFTNIIDDTDKGSQRILNRITKTKFMFIFVKRVRQSLEGERYLDKNTIEFPLAIDTGKDLDLQSIICHKGTIAGGHYIVYLKCKKKWRKYDGLESGMAEYESIDDLLSHDKNIKQQCTGLVYF